MASQSWGQIPVVGTRAVPGLGNTSDTPLVITGAGQTPPIPCDGVRDLLAFVQLSAFSGGASIVVYLEHSPDGKTWYPLANTAAITANGNSYMVAGLTTAAGPFGYYARLRWTVSAGQASLYAFVQGR